MRLGPENVNFVTAAKELFMAYNYYIVVVSGSDNTEVTVQDPTAQVWSRTLGRLQTYTHTTATRYDDLTGYIITSNKPVSVFLGTVMNSVLGGDGGDPMYISLPPATFWGTTFFIAPIMERLQPEGHVVRVIALEQTEVRDLVGGMVTTLNAQEFYESRPDDHGNAGGGIKCSRPCLVVQYAAGRMYDASTVDIAMRLVPSVESFVK